MIELSELNFAVISIIFMGKHWSLFSIIILLVSAGWIWLSRTDSSSTTSGNIPSPHKGFHAPDFKLETISGDSLQLSDLSGQPVIINLWASWCVPCRTEMPAMQRVYEEYKPQGLEILAVNTTNQDSIQKVSDFVSELGLSFPILMDNDGIVSNLYQSQALPTTFFLNRSGIIQDVVIGGPMSEALLRIRVQQMMEDR